jgi:hypothetical protein
MEFSIVLTKISNPERHRIFITALNTDEVTAARLTFLSKKEKGN